MANGFFFTSQIELAAVCRAFLCNPLLFFSSLFVLAVNGVSSSQSSAQRSTKSSTPSPTSPRPLSGFKVKCPNVSECGPRRSIHTCVCVVAGVQTQGGLCVSPLVSSQVYSRRHSFAWTPAHCVDRGACPEGSTPSRQQAVVHDSFRVFRLSIICMLVPNDSLQLLHPAGRPPEATLIPAYLLGRNIGIM